MNYLTVAILNIVKRPIYMVLFVMFSLLSLPISIMKNINMIHDTIALVLMILMFVFSTFLHAGVYNLSWQFIKGEPATFTDGAKKYFPHLLGASIVIVIITALAVFLLFTIHRLMILPDVSPLLYLKRTDANLMRILPEFIISIFFIYTVPGIFVKELSGKNALAYSWRFVIKYFSESRIIIFLLLISAVGKITITRWAVNHDYNSVEHWQIIALSSIVTSAILFLIFLVAAQIFDKIYHENDMRYPSRRA